MAKTKTVKEFTEEQARKLLAETEQKKQALFLKEYQELCTKHGYEVSTAPVQLIIRPFKQ
jgi:hypothetical protein